MAALINASVARIKTGLLFTVVLVWPSQRLYRHQHRHISNRRTTMSPQAAADSKSYPFMVLAVGIGRYGYAHIRLLPSLPAKQKDGRKDCKSTSGGGTSHIILCYFLQVPIVGLIYFVENILCTIW